MRLVNRNVAILIVALFSSATAYANAITATNPARNAKSAPRATNIEATADSNIEAATVTQSTFRIQGAHTGRIAGTYSASGTTFQLDPTNNLKPGELIRVSATSGIQSTSLVPLTKQVWQFSAATAASTGVMNAHTTPSFGGGDSTSLAFGDLDGDGDTDVIIANYFTNPAQTVWTNNGSGTFTASGSFGTTQHTFAIGLGDLDNDGDLDAVTAHQSSPPGSAIAWVNDGTGAFTQQGTPFGTGSITQDLALGDLDGDGDLDCVLANSGGAEEEVFLNDGTGLFAIHPGDAGFGAGKSFGIDLGDVDGDGDLDAVIANNDGEAETVWTNDGSGVFTAGDTFGAGDSTEVTLGDLDGDGDLDAVVANYSDAAETVWTNSGTGDFSAKSTFGAGYDSDVVLGDLDGDGDLDAVTSTLNGAGQFVWLNDGDGDFIAHPTMPVFGDGLGNLAWSVALTDIDGDGDLDAVVANDNDAAERVYLNTSISVTPVSVVTAEAPSNATFSVVLEAEPTASVSLQIDTSDATEGRLSTDGVTQQDSITLTFTTANWSNPQTVTVHGQDDTVDDGNVAYLLTTAAATSTDPLFSGASVFDVSATNNDNDTSGVNVSPGTVSISENGTTQNFNLSLTSEPSGEVTIDVASLDTGEVTVSPAQRTFDSGNWSTAQSITATGVNDATIDGNQSTTINVTINTGATTDPIYDLVDPSDVVATTVDNDFIIVNTNPATNAKAAPRTTNITASASGGVQHSATVNQSTWRIQGEKTGRIVGFYGGASGNAMQFDPTNDLKPGETIKVTATSGILGPNDSPLVPEVWQFTAAAGTATGVMSPHPTTPSFHTGTTSRLVLGDLNGDGDLDALSANNNSLQELVLVNDGQGNLTIAPASNFGGGHTLDAALGDLDGDGDLDAICANNLGQAETIWLNNGAGYFSAPETNASFGTGDSYAIELGDVDGDGDLDAVVANWSGEAETVWKNDGSAGFTSYSSFGTGDSSDVALGDLDGDGDLDAVVANANGESETVWLNDGAGNFTPHPTTASFGPGPTGTDSYGVALGDLDGDGDADAVIANLTAETVWINDGTGAFTPHATPAFGGEESQDIALGDLDGDGDLDAVVANGSSEAETVWLNNGAGVFALHSITPSFGAGTTSASVSLGDLDGDGDLDAIVANSQFEAETVWINRNPAGINVTPTSGLTTTEAGATTTFTVVLTSQPVVNVSVQLDTSDATEGRISTDGVTQQTSVTLTFTTSNWATPQTITLHGQNDDVDDGNINYSITTAAAVTTDVLYSGFNAADVFATNIDDDTAGVTVSVGAWTQLFPTGTAPTARYGAGGAYDAANERLMFFSGNTIATRPQDTWVLARATGVSGTPFWQQLSPTGGPPAGRSLHRAVFAPSSNRMILYGGCTVSCGVGLQDVWALSNANGLGGTPSWVSLPAGSIRNAYAVGYDTTNRRMMVYGGFTASANSCKTDEQVLADADGIGSPVWSSLSLSPGPGARGQDVNGAYDPGSNRLIVFGGHSCPAYLNDVWVMTNANGLGGSPAWIQLAPTGTAPSPRSFHSTFHDSATNRLIVFGGGASDGLTLSNEVWVLTNGNGLGGTPAWIRQTPSGTPPAGNRMHVAGYSPSTNRLVIAMGETSSGLVADVWVLSNANGALTVTESGTTATFTVVLDSEPTGTVVIDLSSGDTSEATVSPEQLTFTSGTWSTPQIVTVTGENDATIDNDQQTTISVSMNTGATTDPLYDAIDPTDVPVTTIDDDFVITSTSPAANAKSAPRTTNIAATTSGTVQSPSVTQTTFRVQGEQTGRIAGTFSASGTTFSLDPATNLKPGELIKVTATNGILGPNNAALRQKVWQFTAAAGAGTGAFVSHPTTPTFGGLISFDSALGDLDGDGDLDVLVANYLDHPKTVYVNDGAGNFTLHQSFGTNSSTGVALGDLDGDGDLDAVISNDGQAHTVWRNNGSGTFSAHPTTPSFGASAGQDVALGDLDGDGDLDAVIANGGTAAETVWLNDGSGNFTEHPTMPGFGAENSQAVALGDLDNDGDLDALIGSTERETVWLNDGRGSFTPHPTVPDFGGPTGMRGIALGDLDGDGDLDAVVARLFNEPETVWRNGGTGNFTAHPTTPSFGGGNSYDVALGDLDGDGDLDAVVADAFFAPEVVPAETVWRNDGAGNFTPHPITPSFGDGNTIAAALGDVDGDNDLDVLVSNGSGEPESVWINRNPAGAQYNMSGVLTTEAGGTATFTLVLTSQPIADVSFVISSSDISEGKLSTDGVTQQTSVTITFTTSNWNAPQTITVHGQNDSIDDGNVTFFINTAAATSTDPIYSGFNTSTTLALQNVDDDTAGVTVTPAAVTVDESGTTAPFSVVLTSEPTGNVVIDVSSNDTTEATVSPAQLTFTNTDWSTPKIVTVTGVNDVDIDGNQQTTISVTMNLAATNDAIYDAIDPTDVTATTTDDDFVVVSTSPAGNAKSAPRTTNVAATASGTVQSASIAQSTFRVQGNQTGRIAGALSAANTTFQLDPTNNLKPGETVRVTATSAILGPSDSPLVPQVWQFTAAAGVASGAMTAHPTTPSFGGGDTWDLALADLDGDGDLDAIAANQNAELETVWVNDGAGNFSALSTFDGGWFNNGLALGDLDGDGDLDVLITGSDAEAVFLNNGSGTFLAHPLTPTFGGTAQKASLGDLDGDGDLDAVLAIFGGPESVWLNDGTGAFSAHPTASSFGGDNSQGIALGDLDGDGDLDAIVANADDDGEPETVWLNNGAGVFTAHPTPSFGGGQSFAALPGDLDGDGDLDVLIVNDFGSETVWLNNGSGAFTQHATVFGPGRSFGGTLGDLDGDSDLDAIITDLAGPATVWLNDGLGGFSAHPTLQTFGTGTPVPVALGDLDADGDLYAVVGNYSNGVETVWINRSPAGINVTPTSGLVTTEALGTTTFTVVLISQPLANVSIQIDSSDTTEGRLSTDGTTQQDSVTVIFTSANWDTPRTITVHGQNDDVDDGNINYTLTTANATSTDPLYNGLASADVSASNTDNDTAGVNVTPTAVTVSESGTSAGFTVVLTSQPTGSVVIDLASGDPGEATVSTSQLTFTTGDWSTPKNVTVTGVDDALDDGDQNTTISVSMNTAATADALYDAIDPADVTATTTDDDAPFGAPPNFAATATSTSTVVTSWGSVAGATNYELWRTTSISIAYTLVTATTSTSFNNTGLSANTTYLYKVLANGSGGPSPFSAIDPATTIVFTDPTLTTATTVKAIHVTQLRTAVNALRAAGNLLPTTFTDTPPVSIKRIHIVELRNALDQARTAIVLPALTYTDPTINIGTTKVKKEHIAEPRAGTQ